MRNISVISSNNIFTDLKNQSDNKLSESYEISLSI